jgi:hypothetical protein
MRSGPGREATVHCFAGQLGACWAELGPHYDSINEAVSLPLECRTSECRTLGQCMANERPPPSRNLRVFARLEALAGAPVRRDHDYSETLQR